MSADHPRYPDSRRRPGRPALIPADVVDHRAETVGRDGVGTPVADHPRDRHRPRVSTSTVYKWSCQGAPHFPRSIRLRNDGLRVRVDWYEEWLETLGTA